MLTHNYHGALARQIGVCWDRTSEDVAWTPLPLYHFNALTTVVIGTLLYGGRGAIYRQILGVELLVRDEPVSGRRSPRPSAPWRTFSAHDIDRPEMPLVGCSRKPTAHCA